VLAPQAVTGEFGGGTLAPAILALQGAGVAVPGGCNHPDPMLEVRLEAGPAPCAEHSSRCACGVSAWILFERP
jgi:hypothetical protein